MTAILLAHGSGRQTGAVSRGQGEALVARLGALEAGGVSFVRRNLTCQPPTHFDLAYADAILRRTGEQTGADLAALRDSGTLSRDLEPTDPLVISRPVQNFTVPAVLKAWNDQALKLGRSSRRVPQGKQGLHSDRPTFIIVASAGVLTGPGATQPDFLTAHLFAVIATMGLSELAFGCLDGLAVGHAAVVATGQEIQSWMPDTAAFSRFLYQRNGRQLGPPGMEESK